MPARPRPTKTAKLSIVADRAAPQAAADAHSYAPFSDNTRAVLELTRPKAASVYCNVTEERNAANERVFTSYVSGSVTLEPGGLVEGAVRLIEEHLTGGDARTDWRLNLELGRGVELTDLAHFAAALKAVVDELFAQGGNDKAWNSHGEGVGDSTLAVVLDPRAPRFPKGAAVDEVADA